MIKPFKYPMKGANNMIGYGCSSKKRRSGYKRKYKRQLRDFRKFGFDTSECWSLDYTLMCWLSDNVGGFFRECGSPDDWTIEEEKVMVPKFEGELKKWLDSKDENFDGFTSFVIPRINWLIKYSHGFPAMLDSFEEWTNILQEMNEAFKNDTYSEKFITYFFNLWD